MPPRGKLADHRITPHQRRDLLIVDRYDELTCLHILRRCANDRHLAGGSARRTFFASSHRQRGFDAWGTTTARSKRAAISGNAAVGPCQRNSSTESKTGTSVRSVARSRNRNASLRLLSSVADSDAALAALTCQSRGFDGIN